MHALSGDNEAAAREAIAVAGDGEATPAWRAYARAILADVRRVEGRAAEALGEAEEALSTLPSLEGSEEGEAFIRVVHAEALEATGDRERARAAIVDARDRLLARAGKVVDPALRQSFLDRVAENARTLRRARELLDDPQPL